MIRFDSPAVQLLELERKTGQNGKTEYFAYTPPDAQGTMRTPRAGITLLHWGDGATAPWGKPYQFEYHTLHEEIFVLTGALNFSDFFTLTAPAYKNHPPFWVHPTNFWAVGNLTMLLRGDTDPIVQFEPIPENWDGREHLAWSKPTRCTGVTRMQLDEKLWAPIRLRSSSRQTGLEAKRIWDDHDDGWTTWLMKVGAGWKSQGPTISVDGGGDEIYVIDGDLTVGWASATLRPSGYTCAAKRFVEGAGVFSSRGGATFLRWTRGAERAWDVEGVLLS